MVEIFIRYRSALLGEDPRKNVSAHVSFFEVSNSLADCHEEEEDSEDSQGSGWSQLSECIVDAVITGGENLVNFLGFHVISKHFQVAEGQATHHHHQARTHI